MSLNCHHVAEHAVAQPSHCKASEIEAWLNQLASSYNILSMNADAFRAWARLMRRKSDTLYEDAMIAAIALSHGLTVATRNVADFEALGMHVLNPFEPDVPSI